MAKDQLTTCCSLLVLTGMSSIVIGAFLSSVAAGCITLGVALVVVGILGRASLE